MRPSRAHLFAALIPIALLACEKDPSGPGGGCLVQSVTVTGAPASLSVGSTAQLIATLDTDNCTTAPTVSWSSSDNGRAIVSTAGVVTGVSAGSVTITASAGGKSGTATFPVAAVVAVASVRVTPEEIVIGVGPALTLVAEALDADGHVLPGKTVAWSVSGGTGATVSPTGVLTGVTAGQSATITATIEGAHADVDVHVVRTRIAFFWNNLPTPGTTSVPPDAGYRYSSLGTALKISSTSVGEYTADFEGLGREGIETEAFFVTAYGTVLGGYCNNMGWGSDFVDVSCYDGAGNLANSRFTVAQLSSATLGGRFGYSYFADGGTSVDGQSNYRFNSAGGNIHSTRNATGDYTVRFVGLGRVTSGDREAVVVNAYASDRSCQPVNWTTVGTDLDVNVRCFTVAGAPADTRYTILVADQARPGARLAIANATEPTTSSYTPANSAVRPSGGVQVTRTAVGMYDVTLSGFFRSGDLRETFLVTATGTTPGRCHVRNWAESLDAGLPTTVSVLCSTLAGAAADLPFSIIGLQ